MNVSEPLEQFEDVVEKKLALDKLFTSANNYLYVT